MQPQRPIRINKTQHDKPFKEMLQMVPPVPDSLPITGGRGYSHKDAVVVQQPPAHMPFGYEEREQELVNSRIFLALSVLPEPDPRLQPVQATRMLKRVKSFENRKDYHLKGLVFAAPQYFVEMYVNGPEHNKAKAVFGFHDCNIAFHQQQYGYVSEFGIDVTQLHS